MVTQNSTDFLFCKNLINDFISTYLNGDISGFSNFDFEKLNGDKKFGCPGRSFDCDDTNLTRAICFLLWNDIFPNLTFAEIGTGKKYRGDTLNTFNSVLGAYLPEEQSSIGIIKSSANIQLKASANQFHQTYHSLGNFILLPNISELDIKRSYTLNTYRGTAYKDFFDLFLKNLFSILTGNMIDARLSNLVQRNDFFFSWLNANGGLTYLSEICWLDDYFINGIPKSVFSPYISYLRKKQDWSDSEKSDYVAFVEKYILLATSIINRRSLIMIEKLNKLCH